MQSIESIMDDNSPNIHKNQRDDGDYEDYDRPIRGITLTDLH